MKTGILLFLAATLTANPARALQLRTYSAARHDRFTGFPSAPVANPAFLHAGLDLTGVGWDVSYVLRQVTLIAPQYFVCANHFRPPVGGEIRFLSSGGVVRSATVQSLFTIPNANGQPTDVLIGRLAAPMLPASGVKFLPCHLLDTEAAYAGQTLGVLGQPARGGKGVIGVIADFGGDPITGGAGINTTRTMQFNYTTLTGSADDAYAESGDSGSPSFVAVNGRAAVVGTHTAVLNAAGTVTTFDSFLPAYLAPVNAVLEADGYHLTAAAPKTTTMTLATQVTPAVLRAGYPVTFQLTLTNSGLVAAANNVKLDTTLAGVAAVSPTGAAGWVFSPGAGSAQARRGGLAANTGSVVTLMFTPSAAGTIQRSVTYSADETAPATVTAGMTVVESFKSWTAGLNDVSTTGDDDRDGQDNLTEYAFCGDPRVASTKVQGSSVEMTLTPLRREPSGGSSRQVVRFIRRTDAAQRQLDYRVETSATMAAPWTDVTVSSAVLSTTAVAPGCEAVELALPASTAARQFVRLRVSLNE